MELSITTLLYLFFRLSPFIIASYFSLSSVFNQDVKGLIYLAGLLISCFIAVLFGNMVGGPDGTANSVCNLITIGNGSSFSNIPLGNVMLSYTFAYLAYVIFSYNIALYNIPTLILLPMLMIGDAGWNLMNKCFNGVGILLGLAIGCGIGVFWAYIIQSIGKPDLFFLNVGSDQSVCKRPSKQLYKCTFNK